MNEIHNATVSEIAANSIAAVRVFERLGIDYCCGGKKPLAEVCQQKGYDVVAVGSELEAALRGKKKDERDWNGAPLCDLIDHIVSTHHGFLRRELPALAACVEKVYRVYNQRYGPTLGGLPEIFADLRGDLESHLCKEEIILFPAIVAYERAVDGNRPLPSVPFGTVVNPIGMMEHEHESAGQALAAIRRITRDFEIPAYACSTYTALMTGLRELEQDLHVHIHLENNILFPRAAVLEKSQAS